MTAHWKQTQNVHWPKQEPNAVSCRKERDNLKNAFLLIKRNPTNTNAQKLLKKAHTKKNNENTFNIISIKPEIQLEIDNLDQYGNL